MNLAQCSFIFGAPGPYITQNSCIIRLTSLHVVVFVASISLDGEIISFDRSHSCQTVWTMRVLPFRVDLSLENINMSPELRTAVVLVVRWTKIDAESYPAQTA